MADKYWTNVAVGLASSASGYGTGITINAISKANPGVVSYTGTDPANGNYVLLEVQGMTQVNNRLFKVAAVDAGANTFELAGEDTTLYNTFSSGTFKVVTFDLSFNTLMEPQSSGGDPITEDGTTIHDPEDIEDIVSSSAQGYTFVSKFAPDSAALIECNKAFKTRTPRALRITYSDGSNFSFYGTCVATMAPGASGRKVTTPLSFRLKSSGTSYAT